MLMLIQCSKIGFIVINICYCFSLSADSKKVDEIMDELVSCFTACMIFVYFLSAYIFIFSQNHLFCIELCHKLHLQSF